MSTLSRNNNNNQFLVMANTGGNGSAFVSQTHVEQNIFMSAGLTPSAARL